jgi:hypothetical protein
VIRRLLTRPLTWIVIVLIGAGGAAGLYWFQPWRLFTDTTVSEVLSQPAPSQPVPSQPAPSQPVPSGPAPVAGSAGPAVPTGGPTLIREGAFITHEHATSGTARLIRNPDGSHQVELAGLDTSDGPDLWVWLTDQPVLDGPGGWRTFDDGRYLELGRLKGNRGDQVYRITADADPSEYRSVTIWCKRFAVSFGAAPLR